MITIENGAVVAGSTSVRVLATVRNATSGALLTGLAFGTSGLVASYARWGSARTAITLVTNTVGGAYSSGGFVEVDATNMPGLYQIDIPNAAVAAGAEGVTIQFTGANADCVLSISLDHRSRRAFQAVTGTLNTNQISTSLGTVTANVFRGRRVMGVSGANTNVEAVVTANDTAGLLTLAPPLVGSPSNLDWFVFVD